MKKYKEKTGDKNKRKPKKELRAALLWLIIPISAIALALIINLVFIVNSYVPSGSMEETLKAGSLVLGNRLAYKNSRIEQGDIVFFRHEEFGSKILVKRVIALEGDEFSMKNGRVYINGEILEEDYIEDFGNSDFDAVCVPKGKCIMLGDNRKESKDSRFWETPFACTDDIIAKASFAYFPEFYKLN